MTHDLIVIGGGPAGCAAAITAARAGCKVLLLERGHYPRHRVCGEFVSAESLTVLSHLLGTEGQALLKNAPRISESRVFVDSAVLRLPVHPPASSISRFDLDRALWNSCLSNGVDARPGISAESISGDGPFTVAAKGVTFQSDALINAAGRWSLLTNPAVRSQVACERWVGLKAYFRETQPSPSVDLYFFSGGYCGVQPVALAGEHESQGTVNACAMVRADKATQLSEVFALHPGLRERSRTWVPAMDPVSTSPLIFHKPEPVQGRMLQVGDAATFVDPFIGDGISLALRSGALASQCLAKFLQREYSLFQAASEYEMLYRRRLVHVFRASSLLRRALRAPSILRRPAISLLQRRPAMARGLVRMTR